MDKATQVMTVILVDIWYFNYGFLFSQHTFWADLQEVINAIVEAQSCGLGLPVNKISLGPDLPTISFTVWANSFILYTYKFKQYTLKLCVSIDSFLYIISAVYEDLAILTG